MCYVKVSSTHCVCGCWVAWIVGPDGEPIGVVPLLVEEPCNGQAELA